MVLFKGFRDAWIEMYGMTSLNPHHKILGFLKAQEFKGTSDFYTDLDYRKFIVGIQLFMEFLHQF